MNYITRWPPLQVIKEVKMQKSSERKCLECPAFYKCSGEGISATAGGWEEKRIDDQTINCCRPAKSIGAKRTMTQYCLYCLAMPTGKKIGHLASWTGRTPKWCPLGRELKERHEK